MSKRRVFLLAVAVWLLFLVLAVCLGAVRELLVSPAIGEQAAHVAGTLAFVGVMLGVTGVFVWRTRTRCSVADFWRIGLLWLALTVAFEFLFFHFVAGKPWKVLLADYNRLRGRIWLLVPLTELFGPPTLGWLLRSPPESHSSGRDGSAPTIRKKKPPGKNDGWL